MRLFLSIIAGSGLIAIFAFKAGVNSFAARQVGSQTLMLEMDQEVIVFNRMKNSVGQGDECLPIRVGGMGQVDLQYLSCSDGAFAKDGESFAASEHITVPREIARRVNFWRRVYSLWSVSQDVLHVSNYPEVVLEIHDSSRLSSIGDKTRSKIMKPWMDVRRKQYQQILWKFANLKTIDESQLSTTERRVLHLFDHIPEKNKFAKAAASLRVQRGQREFIAKGIVTASKYLPHAEAEFQRQGLMPELARIAFIESSFNLQAYSKVGASGVYQVMPETGRDYLVVSGEIDERNDPIKASRAAAKLLAMNYKILGQWPLAITAYNHGVGGIARAMREKQTSDIVTLINKYDGNNFGFASKNFYSGFLGLLSTLKSSSKVFPDLKLSEPLHFELVRVGNMSLVEVKAKYKLNTGTIGAYNPDIGRVFLKAGGVFPERYMLKIPSRSNTAPNMKLASWVP